MILPLGTPYARFLEYGTITGRFTRPVPPFKEIPSMSIDRNPMNIMDPKIRRLSEFVFKHYHSNPSPNQHSRVSDTFAVNIAAADPEVTMELATLLAHIAGAPEHMEVTTFAMRQKQSNVEDTDQLPDWLRDLCRQNAETTADPDENDTRGSFEELLGRIGIVARNLGTLADDGELYDENLVDEDGDLNHRVLWARVWRVLGGDEADVSFDHAYQPRDLDYPVPAVHGPNVTPLLVNGAIVEVLDKANRCDLIDEALGCMANRMDEDGWVYCHDNLPN